jgi:predicted RNA-binding Zn ribbon-like protein
MTSSERKPFGWVGGRPALDFLNTRAWFVESPASERFRSALDLLEWGMAVNFLTEDEAANLRDACHDHAFADEFLAEGIQLRAQMHALLRAIALDEVVPHDLLTAFNRRLAAAAARMALVSTASSRVFHYTWVGGHADPDRLFQQIVWDAAQLLTSADATRLRTCGNDRCGWVFLDTSRNGRRRWCDMAVCGNRVKSRRRYARSRDTGETAS